MYVNTWLAGEDPVPGDCPSGGAQPRVIDVWKAAGTAIDIYSHDLYASNFSYWANRYHRDDNPLFIPANGAHVKLARACCLGPYTSNPPHVDPAASGSCVTGVAA
jgi:hypothetical protein